MALKQPLTKLYYSIGEIAEMFHVNTSLIRFWEKEFPFITPKKAGGNVRQYRKEDIENIRLVYHLVKENSGEDCIRAMSWLTHSDFRLRTY